jgi:hypothetical protein
MNKFKNLGQVLSKEMQKKIMGGINGGDDDSATCKGEGEKCITGKCCPNLSCPNDGTSAGFYCT